MLLLDNSAWAQIVAEKLPRVRARSVAKQMAARELAVCLPFLLEAGYSARSGRDWALLMRRLRPLPMIEVDHEVELRAVEAQRELAEVGHHRLSPVDIMIATCAHVAEAGVLHYDGDYDLIARHTSLVFNSAWLVPAGSLAG